MFNLFIEPFNQFSKNKKKPILKMASGGLSPLDDTLPTAEQAADYKKDKALRKQVQKMLQYERLRGSATGTGLDNFGIDPKKHPNYKGGEDIEAATDYVLDTYGSKLRVEDSAIAKGEALDFMYNSGKDPYAYGYQEYLRKYKPNDNSWKENGSNNWNDRKNTSGEDLMKMYDESVGKLSENERRILLNKGRDWYYQNIDQVEGKPNPAYEKTWFGRMWNMNDDKDFDPKNPKFTPKIPKMLFGGTPPLVESSVTPNPTGLEGLDDPYYGKGKQITGTTNAQPMTWNTTPATPATIINGSSMGLNQQNKLGLQMTSLDPTAMTGDTKEAKGQRNVAGLTNMAGNFGGMLMGVGGAMLNNMKGQSEQQSLDYLQYQNQGIQSMQDINRGGGLQLLMMGGKVKPRKYPQGGVVGGEMPQPVQTEVKEKIITQDGSIFDTKATKKHKDMKSSEITDVLPADSYVISNRIMLKKSKAEKIVLGLQPLLYKEGGDKSKYKEFRLSDIFTKDEMSLSELTDNLRKLYPTDLGDNQKGNIFAQRTSDANKASRALLLGELIKLNEDGKSSNKNQGEVAKMPYGGLPTNYWNPDPGFERGTSMDAMMARNMDVGFYKDDPYGNKRLSFEEMQIAAQQMDAQRAMGPQLQLLGDPPGSRMNQFLPSGVPYARTQSNAYNGSGLPTIPKGLIKQRLPNEGIYSDPENGYPTPYPKAVMPQAQPVIPGTKTNYWDGPIRKDYPDIKPEQRNTEFMIDNSDLLRGLKFNSVNTDPRANRPGGRGAGNGRATVRPKGIAPQPVVPVAPYTPPTPPTYQTPDVQGGVPEGLYKDDPRFGPSTPTDLNIGDNVNWGGDNQINANSPNLIYNQNTNPAPIFTNPASRGTTNSVVQGQSNPNKPVVNEYDQYIQYTQNQMNGLDRDFRRNSRDNTNAFMSNVGGVLGGSMTAMAGLLGQNPRVEAPNLKTPDLPRQMDKSYFDYLAYQNNKNTNAVANAALSNTSDYSKAMNYITAAGGKAMEANSQLGAQAAQINLGLESQYQQAKNQVQNQQAMLDVNAKNETNKFINNLVGQSAGIGTNAINNIAALNNQRINYNAKNRSEKTSRYSTLINQMMMLRQLQKGMPISFGATTATATQ